MSGMEVDRRPNVDVAKPVAATVIVQYTVPCSTTNNQAPVTEGSEPDTLIHSNDSPQEDVVPLETGDNDIVEILVNWKGRDKDLRITMSRVDFQASTVLELKEAIAHQTDIPCARQFLLGIAIKGLPRFPKVIPKDSTLLRCLEFSQPWKVTLIGTPSHQLAAKETGTSTVNFVVDDWDTDFTLNSKFHLEERAKQLLADPLHYRRLCRILETTNIHLISAIRKDLPLLILDLDSTLLDCKGLLSSSPGAQWAAAHPVLASVLRCNHTRNSLVFANDMGEALPIGVRRPYLEEFMRTVGSKYNIGIWSQTSWKWAEMKCTELGLLSSELYSIVFVLDRSTMFNISSVDSKGKPINHVVKALQVIWNQFPFWSRKNTVHLDDLARNFVLNPSCGVKISSYRRWQRLTDKELIIAGQYLDWLASIKDFELVDHQSWRKRVVAGKLQSGTVVPVD